MASSHTKNSSAPAEATILFAEVLGFPELLARDGVDRAYASVTGCLTRLDDVARRYGGAVDKYLGDQLMVVFGFPVGGHDPERRALAAALEMREVVEQERRESPGTPLGLRVGINTGPVFAGDVGAHVVREFAVMGDAVNVSARLRAKAQSGQIVVGPRTAEAGDGAFVFDVGPELQLKGRQRSVRPSLLVDALDSFGSQDQEPTAFFGRIEYLDDLLGAMTALRAGEGGVRVVLGAAGSGKTRLIREWLATLSEVPIQHISAQRLDSEVSPLRDADEGPRVVVVDDLHRAGPVAWVELERWLKRCAESPTLMLLAGRPPSSEGWASFDRSATALLGDSYQAGELAPLAPGDVEKLLDALEEAEILPPDIRSLAKERGQGQPGPLIQAAFLSEALRADAGRESDALDRSEEPERRRVSVLFADLSGFTARAEFMEPSDLHALVSAGLAGLDRVAAEYGGTVEKHLGDCVMAIWGVPVAVEDGPRSAVAASLEMRRLMEAFNRERELDPPLEVHIGVDTGVAVVGDVSGPMIREWVLMGEAVSGASELMDLAPPGDIFIGELTRRETEDLVVVEPDPGGTKGAWKISQATPSAPTGGRRRSARVGSFVGREDELARLRRATAALEEGLGGFAAVVGEAGLGKTRLVEELLGDLPEGVLRLEARSLPLAAQRGFHPFSSLLHEWCGTDPNQPDHAAWKTLGDRLGAILEDSITDTQPFLATLMGIPLPDEDRARLDELGGEALPRLILAAMTRWLRGLANSSPVVLVFEDLHWADTSSIDLLESLLREVEESRVLMLVVTRPHFPETSERIRVEAERRLGEAVVEADLEPLTANDALALLRSLLRGGDVPPALLTTIRDRAAGNPFFVEEAVRALVDDGALEEVGGTLRATARIAEFEVPGTIQEVIMARIDRQPRPRRDLLRGAAAIGLRFAEAVLEAVANTPEFEGLLEALIDAELIVRESGGTGLRFRHPLIQEVAYDSIVEQRKEELHGQIGEAIEAHLTDQSPGYHAMLAYHYSRGGNLERAEDYLFRAGDEAARSAASDEALRFFQEASALYLRLAGGKADPERLATLERNIAHALANRGLYVDAIDHFDEALRHRGVPVATHPVALGVRLVRDLAIVMGRLYLPMTRRRRPPATELQKAVQELIYDRARAQTTSAVDRYLFDWMDGLRRLESADPATMPLAGGQLSSTVGIFSFGGVSFAVSERFLALAKQLIDPENPEDRMIFGFMNYFHHTLAGNWGEEAAVDDELVEDRIRNGQLFDVTNYLAFAAEKRVFQGRFEEARQLLTRLDGIADLYQFDLALSSVHGVTAFMHLEKQEWQDAIRAADIHYTEHRDPLVNLLALGTQAKARMEAGELAAGLRSLEAAERLLQEAPGVVPPYHRSAVLRSRLLYEVLLLEAGEGSAHAAKKAGRKALRATTRVACRQAEILRLEGTRRWLSGDRKGAKQWWQRSADTAKRLGMEPEGQRIRSERDRRLGTASNAASQG